MKQKDPQSTRAAILDAAESVFSNKGFSGASMSDIAGSAGVHQSLIHHHFGTKRDLWNTVVARYTEQYLESQRTTIDFENVTPKTLDAALEADFRFWLRRPDLLRLEAWASLERDTPPDESPGSMCTPFIPVVQGLQKAGVVRKDIEATSLIIVAAGAVTYWIQKRAEIAAVTGQAETPALDERFLSDMLKLLAQGWRPQGKAKNK